MADEPLDREKILARAYAKKPGEAARTPEVGPPRRPIGPVALVVILALAVGGWFLAQKLLEVSKIQDCVMQGRKNCDHIDDPHER